MHPFGSGEVVVSDSHVVDDGNFYTQNDEEVFGRWLQIRDANNKTVFGSDPPRDFPKEQFEGKPIFSREDLKKIDLAHLVPGPGIYTIRVWGVNGSNPDKYEVGSGNPADNGTTETDVHTTFAIREVTQPPVPPQGDPTPDPVPGQWTLESNEKEMVRIGYELIEEWRESGRTERQIADTMHYQVVRALMERSSGRRSRIKAMIKSVLG